MTPNATNNSYSLEIGGNKCFVVGGKSVTANSWTWVDYQNGNTASKIELDLSKGSHSLRFIGRQADVRLDRVIATSDLGCVPTGNGANCDVPSDTKPPTVSIAAPPENANVSNTVTVKANVSDDVAVAKVEFYSNSTLLGSDTTAPYSYDWDTTKVPNGRQVLIVKAYDTAGNVSTDSYGVWTRNGDTTAPKNPEDLSVKEKTHNSVTLSWKASSDDTGVIGYRVIRDGVPVGNVAGITFDDRDVLPNTQYVYKVTAYDAAGNSSGSSNEVTAKTLNVADKQAPTKPLGLSGKPAGTTQANLTWHRSTDNVGVAAYEVYRQTAGGSAKKVAEVRGTSFGDAALKASNSYTYYVIARDVAGNRSSRSDKVTVKTNATTQRGAIKGRVFSSKSGKPTGNARVEITVNGSKRIYTSDKRGEYAISGLRTGSYNVTYSKSTYHSQSFTIKVNESVVKRDVTLRLK
jgi:chitodextrinase